MLEPLYLLTKRMQAEQYTAGDLDSDLATAHYQLLGNTEYRDAALEMETCLRLRTNPLINSIQFRTAVFMGPRIVHVNWTTEKEILDQTIVPKYLIRLNFSKPNSNRNILMKCFINTTMFSFLRNIFYRSGGGLRDWDW